MVSAIDATKPIDGAPASKADMRTNFAAAKSEIEALQSTTSLIAPLLQGGMRNRLMNGAFRINQRFGFGSFDITSASETDFNADRWNMGVITGGITHTTTHTQTGGPTGFPSYIRIQPTAVRATPTAGDRHRFGQAIEGMHTSDLLFGTSSAKSMTLSFWARAFVAGQYGVALQNGATSSATLPSRSYATSYTISSSNVWQRFVITIPGDGSGTWETLAGRIGMRLYFDVGCGTDWRAPTPNTWASATHYGIAGNFALMASTSNWLDITGVQLEPGTVVSPFDYRFESFETLLCSRYYCEADAYNIGVSSAPAAQYGISTNFPVTMSGNPTLDVSTLLTAEVNITSVANVSITPRATTVRYTTTAAGAYSGSRLVKATAELY